MIEKTVKILNSTGIHARPAGVLAKEVKKFNSKVGLVIRDRRYEASSIMSILSMGAKCGDEIVVQAEGEDAQMVLDAVAGLFATQFGE